MRLERFRTECLLEVICESGMTFRDRAPQRELHRLAQGMESLPPTIGTPGEGDRIPRAKEKGAASRALAPKEFVQ
jgi:hypothetical protein